EPLAPEPEPLASEPAPLALEPDVVAAEPLRLSDAIRAPEPVRVAAAEPVVEAPPPPAPAREREPVVVAAPSPVAPPPAASLGHRPDRAVVARRMGAVVGVEELAGVSRGDARGARQVSLPAFGAHPGERGFRGRTPRVRLLDHSRARREAESWLRRQRARQP